MGHKGEHEGSPQTLGRLAESRLPMMTCPGSNKNQLLLGFQINDEDQDPMLKARLLQTTLCVLLCTLLYVMTCSFPLLR